jgi:hypothetical protein
VQSTSAQDSATAGLQAGGQPMPGPTGTCSGALPVTAVSVDGAVGTQLAPRALTREADRETGDAAVRTSTASDPPSQAVAAAPPAATPLVPLSRPAPDTSLPPLPLPSSTALTGSGCGPGGFGRTDNGRSGDPLAAATRGDDTPVPSVHALGATLSSGAPTLSRADDPAAAPD